MMKMSSLMSATEFFAQTAAPAGPAAGSSGPGGFGGSGILIAYALLAGGFYFLFIAPQMKKQKQEKAMRAALKTGDEVITGGGIFGTITNVKEDRFVVRIADNTKIEVTKESVVVVLNKAGSDEKK